MLGIAGQTAGKVTKVRGPPSGEPVAAMVARGETEIGFKQVAELIHVPGISFAGTIPADVQPKTFFAGALTQTSRAPEAAALIRFLASPGAARRDCETRTDAGLRSRWLAVAIPGIGVTSPPFFRASFPVLPAGRQIQRLGRGAMTNGPAAGCGGLQRP